MTIDQVLRRRAAQREKHLQSARGFVDALPPPLDVRAGVVFGSVARGDFNRWSDVDLLIVAAHLPDDWLGRCDALGPRPPGVQPIAWTPDEWRHQLARRNPIAVESLKAGVWLLGSPADLSDEQSGTTSDAADAERD